MVNSIPCENTSLRYELRKVESLDVLEAKCLYIHVSEQAQIIKVTLRCFIIAYCSHVQNKSLLEKKTWKVFVPERIKEVSYVYKGTKGVINLNTRTRKV